MVKVSLHFSSLFQVFIADLTSRSYIHATSHRRRTVQRSDVVAAVTGSNLFDFLVDIVPRGYEGGKAKKDPTRGGEEEDGEGDGDEEEAEEAEDRDTEH